MSENKERKFQIGVEVRLKSGSPSMTVTYYGEFSEDLVHVSFWDGSKMQEASFPEACLSAVADRPPLHFS